MQKHRSAKGNFLFAKGVRLNSNYFFFFFSYSRPFPSSKVHRECETYNKPWHPRALIRLICDLWRLFSYRRMLLGHMRTISRESFWWLITAWRLKKSFWYFRSLRTYISSRRNIGSHSMRKTRIFNNSEDQCLERYRLEPQGKLSIIS